MSRGDWKSSGRECVCVFVCVCVSQDSRTFNSTKGRVTISDGAGDGGGPGEKGGNKAKVYESKGTPNYSYTIHD